ncbi:MAG: hypothetical protein CVV54_04355 [Synergistetes bacterium HGW-Synergistetes-1]|nr:MAG: hypothetical protein CVV54_04355 [Synergistetes bacterium HGW-Synergistetes-1]
MSRQAMPVQAGRVINYLNPSDAAADIKVGDVVGLVSMCGISETNISKGATGAVVLEGVWEVKAVTNAAFAVGDVVYWNAENGYVTKTPTNNVFFGIVIEAKGTTAAKAKVMLGRVALITVNVTEAVDATQILEHTHDDTTGAVTLDVAATEWEVLPVPTAG